MSSASFSPNFQTSIPSTLPDLKGFWENNGVLNYFDGTTSKPVDLNLLELKDAFGIPSGID